MKLAIFGATGKTGAELVRQALEAGHTVTAFVRDPAKLELQDKNLALVVGDVFNPANVVEAVQGQDAILCALGAGSDLKKTTVRTTGTANIISAMQAHGVRRLIAVTAMGVGESWDTLSLLNKIFFAVLLKSAREDHQAQEAAIRVSGLDWTIVRPSGLTDTAKTGDYRVGENIRAETSRISRADVADLILKELKPNVLLQKAITITN